LYPDEAGIAPVLRLPGGCLPKPGIARQILYFGMITNKEYILLPSGLAYIFGTLSGISTV
jgi:hypothetical protein